MIQCEECRIGLLHQKQITFLDWMGRNAIVVANAPALVCDVCGETQYDLEFLDRMQNLMEATPEESAAALRFTPAAISKRRWQQL